MTKIEVLQALRQGKHIRHASFPANLWMRKDNRRYVFTDHSWCYAKQWWRDHDPKDDNNWQIKEKI